MKKRFKLILLVTIAILAAGIALFMYQNTFRIVEKKTAINWVAQGKYNTRKNLQKEGRPEKEIQEIEKYNNQILVLLKSQSSYDDYLNMATKDDLVSKAASKLRTYLTAIFFPRNLFDDKYLNDLTQFVSQFKAD